MKPLILVLLFAISASAQSLTDIARQERERKANLKTEHVLTADTAKAQAAGGQLPAEKPAETKTEPPTASAKPAEAAKATPATVAQTAADAKTANDEAARKYAEDLSKLRARVVALQDQEIAIQLQLNDLKNSFLAPVTDTDARAQAQNQIDQAQFQLAATQQDLVEARRQVQIMEAQAPPKP